MVPLSACKRCKSHVLSFAMADKITGPKRSTKITDRLTYTFANVICCITHNLCIKINTGETGKRLDDHFREHQRDVERNDRHIQISFRYIRATQKAIKFKRKFIFQIGALNLTKSTNTSYATNLAQPHRFTYKSHTTCNSLIRSDGGLTPKRQLLTFDQYTCSSQSINLFFV